MTGSDQIAGDTYGTGRTHRAEPAGTEERSTLCKRKKFTGNCRLFSYVRSRTRDSENFLRAFIAKPGDHAGASFDLKKDKVEVSLHHKRLTMGGG